MRDDGEYQVTTSSGQYFVVGEISTMETSGQVTCPNCDTSDDVVTSVPCFEEARVSPVLLNGTVGRRAVREGSPTWIEAVALALGALERDPARFEPMGEAFRRATEAMGLHPLWATALIYAGTAVLVAAVRNRLASVPEAPRMTCTGLAN